MAAGLGYKDFVTGEVLTAADVDGYLMQGIWVFASAAARDAAVTSPQEGNACYLKDTNAVQTYSGSAWVALGGASSPASANSTITTSQGTTSATYTDLATAQSVTLTTGTKVMVILSTFLVADTFGYGAAASYAISGATTTAVSDQWGVYFQETPRTGNGVSMSYVSYQTVTAGSNTFTVKFKSFYSGGGQTATFANRQITVIDLGS